MVYYVWQTLEVIINDKTHDNKENEDQNDKNNKEESNHFFLFTF
jgi:hypothetical protein